MCVTTRYSYLLSHLVGTAHLLYSMAVKYGYFIDESNVYSLDYEPENETESSYDYYPVNFHLFIHHLSMKLYSMFIRSS